MGDQPSPFGHMEDQRRSPSPKRKKVRQKYAPKACVSCRRSKLKCTGENPCQRCVANGKRCFYSEDQTAAEALQNLSRPAPAQPPPVPIDNGNISSFPRNIHPQYNGHDGDRRPSDASINGMGMDMESRMARMEAMMEALMRERSVARTPTRSIEHDVHEGFRDDNALPLPLLDPINPALEQMVRPMDVVYEGRGWRQDLPPDLQNFPDPENLVSARLGAKEFPYPNPDQFAGFMEHFLYDIFIRYPCIDLHRFEQLAYQFRNSGDNTGTTLELSLHYMAFACSDIATAEALAHRPKGWHWFALADTLFDKKTSFEGPCNLVIIQILFLQSLYFTLSDMPGQAYTTIGLASRLIFQHGLHRQTSSSDHTDSQMYLQSCVFWSIFVLDRSISLSCGRPYAIQEKDIQIALPSETHAKILYRDPQDSFAESKLAANVHLGFMSLLARKAGRLWDDIISGHATDIDNRHGSVSNSTNIDAQIEQCLRAGLISFNSEDDTSVWNLYEIMMPICHKNVLLLLRDRSAEGSPSERVVQLAFDTINNVRVAVHRSLQGEVTYRCRLFALQMTSAIAGSLLVLCGGLKHQTHRSNPQYTLSGYVSYTWEAFKMLELIAPYSSYATRVLRDFVRLRRALFLDGPMPEQQVQDAWPLQPLPADITEAFPYQSLTPALQTSGPCTGDTNAMSQSGVLWV